MKWIIKEDHAGMLIRDYLRNIQHFSRRMLIAAKSAEGSILVNGEKQTVRYELQAGDILEIRLPSEKKGADLVAEHIPIEIVYEDEDILVIHKPAGIASMPSLNDRYGTIANAILGYYERRQIPYTVHIVTRLDRDTSGLMLVAKHRYSHSLLAKAQKAGEIERNYIAIVEGYLKDQSGVISAPIGRDPDSIIKRMVIESGQEAITKYKVIQELKEASVVQVHLITGRTHQIRVHFSYIGHPLIGDTLYGSQTNEIMKRQALHCETISFIHPFTKKSMTFYAALPPDMNRFILQQTHD